MTVAQEMRYRQLKAMDKVVRMHTNDESYIESWLMIGIPDGSTDLDFQEYAADEEDYTEFCETFIRLIKRMDADPHELTREELVDKFIEYL
jgi:hypothetical protein